MRGENASERHAQELLAWVAEDVERRRIDCDEAHGDRLVDEQRMRIRLEQEPVALFRPAPFVQLPVHRGRQGVHVLCERLHLGGPRHGDRLACVSFPCCPDRSAQPADRRRDLAVDEGFREQEQQHPDRHQLQLARAKLTDGGQHGRFVLADIDVPAGLRSGSVGVEPAHAIEIAPLGSRLRLNVSRSKLRPDPPRRLLRARDDRTVVGGQYEEVGRATAAVDRREVRSECSEVGEGRHEALAAGNRCGGDRDLTADPVVTDGSEERGAAQSGREPGGLRVTGAWRVVGQLPGGAGDGSVRPDDVEMAPVGAAQALERERAGFRIVEDSARSGDSQPVRRRSPSAAQRGCRVARRPRSRRSGRPASR